MKIHRVVVGMLLLAGLGMAQELVLLHGKARGDVNQVEQDRFFSIVRRGYEDLGIAFKVVADDVVTAEALQGAHLVMLPFSTQLPETTTAVLKAFVAGGGKLALFYGGDKELLALLGIERVVYRGGEAMKGVAGIRFAEGALTYAPELLPHPSWNILEPELKADGDAKIIGRFVDGENKDLGRAAVVLNSRGLYVAHVLLAEDGQASRRFLLALAGHFIPGLWERAVQARLDNVGKVGGMAGFAELQARMRHLDHAEGNRLLALARTSLDSAMNFRQQRRFGDALAQAEEAVALTRRAFVISSPSRTGELRGVWIHSAYGIADWGWDKTIKVLAEQGFNAIFPNMLWGYVADYPSEVLPVHPRVADAGDQIQQCLDACRKYGLEMHVWKVNWNMGGHTPPELRERMVAAGRTQMTHDGKETRYLAPHLQENFDLEVAAMLEVARKYPVDGIHFDYIRYPGADADFSPSARAAFEAVLERVVSDWPKDCMTGGSLRKEYNDWRRGNISRLVETVYCEAKKLRPELMISAAVFRDWDSAPDSVAQSSDEWVAKGWLDFICPMNYTPSNALLERWLKRQMQSVGQRMPLYSGLGTFLHDDVARTTEQIQLTRRLGASGFVCFEHNKSFAEQFLPLLGHGPCSDRAETPLPHHWPAVTSVRQGAGAAALKEDAELGEEVLWQVSMADGTAFARDVVVAVMKDGQRLELPVSQRLRGRSLLCSYRPAFAGDYQLEFSDPRQGLFYRGPVLAVLGAEELAKRRLQAGPPHFQANGGLRVAVWQQNAYGAAPMLSVLAATPGIDAAPLYNLKVESLRASQVVILPQPRDQSALFKSPATAALLRDYVNGGGRLLVTHALVGIRGYVNAFPELVAAAREPALPGSEWRLQGRHPVTAGLGPELALSTFGDRVAMTPGALGRVVVEAPGGEALMVVGQVGKGRYAACGLGLAIGKQDRDCEMSPAEQALLISTLRWLGERAPMPKDK